MKKVIAGILVLMMLLSTEQLPSAAFPSFVASAVWSSDLIPDPDVIDEVDADYRSSHPDYSTSLPDYLDSLPDNVTSAEFSFTEELITEGEEQDMDVNEEEAEEDEVATPTDIEENMITTPGEAVIDTDPEEKETGKPQ